jgi:hypothetical protein
MDTKDHRILPGTGRATVATLCGYYKELSGGRVVAIDAGAPPCEFYKISACYGYCKHYFCTMCTLFIKKMR